MKHRYSLESLAGLCNTFRALGDISEKVIEDRFEIFGLY